MRCLATKNLAAGATVRAFGRARIHEHVLADLLLLGKGYSNCPKHSMLEVAIDESSLMMGCRISFELLGCRCIHRRGLTQAGEGPSKLCPSKAASCQCGPSSTWMVRMRPLMLRPQTCPQGVGVVWLALSVIQDEYPLNAHRISFLGEALHELFRLRLSLHQTCPARD